MRVVFPGAVRSQQPKDRGLLDIQVDPSKRRRPPKTLNQTLDMDSRIRHQSSRRTRAWRSPHSRALDRVICRGHPALRLARGPTAPKPALGTPGRLWRPHLLRSLRTGSCRSPVEPERLSSVARAALASAGHDQQREQEAKAKDPDPPPERSRVAVDHRGGDDASDARMTGDGSWRRRWRRSLTAARYRPSRRPVETC